MAWSLGEDSSDYTYIRAIQAGLQSLGGGNGGVSSSATAGPTATTTTKQTPTSTTTQAGSTTGVAQWGQCGGNGYTGPTVCVSPYTCKCGSEWWCSCQ